MAQERDIVREAMESSGFTFEGTNQSTDPASPAKQDTPPPVPAPAAATTTEAEPPTTAGEPAKEIAPFDESKFLNERFGDKFKSIDEIKSALKERDDYSTKYAEAEKKSKDLEIKLSENPYANDYIKGLNDFVKKGGDPAVYNKVASIETEKLSDKDALVLKYRFQHGMTKEDAEFKVARKYKLGDSFDPEDPDVRESRIDLQLDGKEAKGFLSEYKTKELTPPDQIRAQKADQELQVRVKSWESQTPQVLESLQKVEVPYDDKNAITFEIPKETAARLSDMAQEVIRTMDVNSDTDGKQFLKEVLLREIFFVHKNDIAKIIAGAKDKQWAKDTHHPSSLKEETAAPAPATGDRDMDLATFIAKANGLKRF